MSDLNTMGVKTVYFDKSFVKLVARIVYFCGLGDVWYEPTVQSNTVKILYKIWCIISNSFILSVVISEFLALMFRDDLNVQETNDSITFCIAHPTILLKFLTVHIYRDKIKDFFRKLIEGTRCGFTSAIEKDAVKKSKRFIIVVALSMIWCMSSATIDSYVRYLREDVPIQTLVPYWPRQTDRGLYSNIARVFIQIHWWYFIMVMVALDSLCFTGLVYLGFRFRSLNMLFSSLRKDLTENSAGKTQNELEDEYKRSFVSAVKLHSDILVCTSNLQGALGNVYNIQIIQNIALVSICLIKLVRNERSFTLLLAVMAFILCMLALTGAYMVVCGDITNEASLVPSAIFYSGWELCSARSQLKPLLVLAIQRSQAPVTMTAFGIFDLSYQNFIQILRTSYSFFAVMY